MILEEMFWGKQGWAIKCPGGEIRTLPAFRRGVTVPSLPMPTYDSESSVTSRVLSAVSHYIAIRTVGSCCMEGEKETLLVLIDSDPHSNSGYPQPQVNFRAPFPDTHCLERMN